MGRKATSNRKNDWLIIRDFRPCQRRYLTEMAEKESVKGRRVIGLSKMAAKIIHRYMEHEGYKCQEH